MLDFERAIAAVQDASAEFRDRQARDSMPTITVEEANAEVQAVVSAFLASGNVPGLAMSTIVRSCAERIAQNELDGLGMGLKLA
jgi:Tfp pilus assembly protein PilX